MTEAILKAKGYEEPGTALEWHRHITSGEDPFRINPGGLYDHIQRWIEKHNLGVDKRIIDVCCGDGITSLKASEVMGASIVGVDISEPLIVIAREDNKSQPLLQFIVGDASNLESIENGAFHAGMMINGIFHLYPEQMILSLKELSRVTKGPILITTINSDAFEFFAGAFDNQHRETVELKDYLPTTIVVGDPSVAGPQGTRIVLKNTPFVMHPPDNLQKAFAEAGLIVDQTLSFGPTSDVGGPDGLDLFFAIELSHQSS